MSRRGVLLLTATILAGAAALAVPWLLARGDGGLRWAGKPAVYRVPGMPSDQILSGQVVNTSTDDLYVDARGIAVVDGGGHRFGTAARFLSAFVHPLYAPFQFHTFGGPSELQRLGIFVRIEPGQRLPLTVSWRNTSSDDQPTQVDLGSEKLPVPS